MSGREVDRTIHRIKDALKVADGILKDSTSTVEQRGDAIGLKDSVEDLINAMCNYTRCVFIDKYKNKTRKQMIENANTVEDYQTECENIEKARKSAHDDLISKVKLADWSCRDIGVAEIYGELPEQYKENIDGLIGEKNRTREVVKIRHAIADWTWDFVLGCTVAMTLENYDKLDHENNAGDNEKIGTAYNEFSRGGNDVKTVRDVLGIGSEER